MSKRILLTDINSGIELKGVIYEIKHNISKTTKDVLYSQCLCDICDLYIIERNIVKDRTGYFTNIPIEYINLSLAFKNRIVGIQNGEKIQIFIPRSDMKNRDYVANIIQFLLNQNCKVSKDALKIIETY